MPDKETTKEVKKTIYQKIATIQATIGAIEKDKTNPAFSNSTRQVKYFDVNSLAAALIPLLHEQGLLLTMPLSVRDGRNMIVLALTDTESGESKEVSSAYLPDNVTIQQLGGAITYLRRYLPVSYFYLQAEDDDGNQASQAAHGPIYGGVNTGPGFTKGGAPTAATKRTEGFQKERDTAEHDIPTIVMDEDDFIN